MRVWGGNAKSFLQGLKPVGCRSVMSELKLRPPKERNFKHGTFPPVEQTRGIGISCFLGELIRVGLVMCVLAVGPVIATAQGLDPTALLRPPADTWPTYNGDYSGRRYSTLDQINAGNVGSLTLAWIYRTSGAAIKSTPLEWNNILYFTEPDNVWALDAKFGRLIWHYERKSEGGHI